VFHLLGRDSEALSASEKALRLFPAGAGVHITRAGALVGLDRRPEAEKELLRAVALAPGGYTWSVLADFYRAEGRADDAIAATRKGADLDVDPSLQLLQLGYYALSVGSPEDALQAFDEAERTAPGARKKDTGGNSFSYKMAAGRAEAWRRLGDNHRAAQAQEQAVQLAPNERQPWLNLAQIYELLGRPAEADRAKAHAASLANSPSP
jgi:tetratricopeptide (TPR) repeat protein